eukprot:772817-Amphidinium_carterae.1
MSCTETRSTLSKKCTASTPISTWNQERQPPLATKATWTKRTKAYSDSDWAGCQMTRKSTTRADPLRVVLQFAGVTISTSSNTQQTMPQTSAEAELYAIGTTVNDVIYVRNVNNERNFTSDCRNPLQTCVFHCRVL